MKMLIAALSVVGLSLVMGCKHGAYHGTSCDKATHAHKGGNEQECEVCKKSEEKSAAEAKAKDCGCGHKHEG